MIINLIKIPVREIYLGYTNNNEDGVTGYSGRLDIRPKYQREFVYKDKQRDAVIESVKKELPLNVMYWAKNGDDSYEIMDGQQRTISICSYISGDFSINFQYFHNLTKDEQEQILNYKLMVYICEGTDKEKLEWFKIINIAGEKLTDQELRNAVYTGEWLTDAKKNFSKSNCAAYNIGKEYLKGSPIRQDYLETAIKWIADKYNMEIEEYMSKNQNEKDATKLWTHFQNVMGWVQITFPKYQKEMKGIEWGYYYNRFKDADFNPYELEAKVAELMLDDDVTAKKGIYEYLVDGQEKHLSIRAFTEKIKREVYERQNGNCTKCTNHFEIDDMEADHITPWSQGGKTISENCQMLCKNCNRTKSDI